MIPHNPFTILYDGLWGLLEASPEFAATFKPGNRVRYDSETAINPLKEAIANADLPEVILIDDGMQAELLNTSSTSKVMTNYSLMISTGDFRWSMYTAQINWIILCNLSHWQTKLGALTWCGQHFVKLVRVLDNTTGQSIPERNRSIEGWTTIWKLQCELHFSTVNLAFQERVL